MKKLILAASLLVASLAHAQVTPTPVTQAKGATFLAVHGISTANRDSAYSKLIDMTGYAGVYVGAYPAGSCAADSYVNFAGAPTANLGSLTDLVGIDSAGRTFGGATSNPSHYWVGPLPNYVRVEVFPSPGSIPLAGACTIDVYLTPTPFSAGAVVSGPLRAGEYANDTWVNPVLMGGYYRTSASPAQNIVTVLDTDANGRSIVTGAAEDGQDLDALYAAGMDTRPLIIGGVENGSPKRARSLRVNSGGQLLTVSTVAGSDGTTTRTLKTRTDGALITTWQPMVPNAPVTKAMSANTSDAVTGLAAGATVDLFCNTDCNFAAGSGTPVASASDNDIPARSRLRYTLGATQTAVGFICASAGVCRVSTVPAGP